MKYLTFDPRTKLFIIIFANIGLMLSLSFFYECLFVGVLLLFFFCLGEWKRGILYLLAFSFLAIVDYQLLFSVSHPVLSFLSFLVIGTRRLLPTLMSASLAMSGTRISEWMAGLQRLRFPHQLIVPLTVLFRFFPMLFQDFKNIYKALRFRGIVTNPLEMLWHPMRSMEYIIIPILMSADNTALDLSATARMRGLGKGRAYTSIYPLKFRWSDYVAWLIMFVCLGGRLFWPTFS